MTGRYESTKWWTKDCQDCPCRKEMFCLWGTYRKKLTKAFPYGREHKPKHCEYRNRPPVYDLEWWGVRMAREDSKTPEEEPVVQRRLF